MIWSDVTFDLIRVNIDCLEIVKLDFIYDEYDKLDWPPVFHWLCENITAKSFVHMISRYYKSIGSYKTNDIVRDTLCQLIVLIDKNISVSRPKRWRLMDFHDHISYLYLLNTTKNKPIEFIIEPYSNQEYSIYQPQDTLTLVKWAIRVKNCVASREYKIGKDIWIFFIERNRVPYYTVETTMDYEIKEIKGPNNSSVTDDECNMALNMIKTAIGNIS
jgi:hypothetical protein